MYNYFENNRLYPYYPFLNNRLRTNPDFDVSLDMTFPYMTGYGPMHLPQLTNYMQPYSLYNNINKNILNLNNDIRRLWIEHAMWTKLVIMSIINGNPNIQLLSERLLKNVGDFSKLFSTFYGATVGEKLRTLLKQHVLISADLVNALKKKDNTSVNLVENKSFKNADDIADLLSKINPYLEKNEIKKILYEHITLIKSESVSVLNKKYEDSITLFDKIEDQVFIIANTFIDGILKQFPNKF